MSAMLPPDVLSDHPPRRPGLYRLKRWLTALGLTLCGVAVTGELLLMLSGYPAALLPLLLAFTAILSLPLLIGTVITPPVSAAESGLVVRPMFGTARLVPWEAIRALRPYTLPPADEGLERLLFGRRRMAPREGMWIIVQGALPFPYRLTAWIGGLGNVTTFAVSAATHQDYERLAEVIHRRAAPAQAKNEAHDHQK